MSSNMNEFLQNLEKCFLNYLSVPDVIENTEFYLSLIDLPDISFKSSLVEKLNNYEKCCFRKCEFRGILLSCKHRLCFDHSQLDICRFCLQENCQVHNRFFCCICNQQIIESDKLDLHYLKCKLCSSTLLQSQFFPGSCKHECFNCLIPSLNRLKRCKICGFEYSNQNIAANCDVCSKTLHLPDIFVNICTHILCLSCLTHSYRNKKCIKCDSMISPKFLMKMENFQKCRCSGCSQRVKTCNSTFCGNCLKDFCWGCHQIHSCR